MWSLLPLIALFHWLSLNPTHTDKPCAFLGDLKGDPRVECGQLQVPENHDQPEGRQIQITYVVLKAETIQENSGPVIYFTGGPGGAALGPNALKQWMQSPTLKTRDLVIFDQRGINYSSALPNMEQDIFQVQAADANIDQEQRLLGEIMKKYRKKAKDQGINLADYNSFQNARDVGKLMSHLGYDKYNLIGGSYGTRLARIVQDMFPDKINSVILNSPSPLGDDFLISRINSYALALGRIFQYCQDQEECRQQYPNLQDDYYQAINALKANPFTVTIKDQEFVVNAQDATYLLRRSLYGNNSRSKAPELIEAFLNREAGPIQEVLNMELALIDGYNSTMWISVERYEMFDPSYTPEDVDSTYNHTALFPERLGVFTSLYLEGKNWHKAELPVEERTFNTSDIPTLIFVNQYDPVTPPINGKIMQKQLTRAQLFIMDEGGHGGGDFQCRFKVMENFMEAPFGTLDTSCLNLFSEN